MPCFTCASTIHVSSLRYSNPEHEDRARRRNWAICRATAGASREGTCRIEAFPLGHFPLRSTADREPERSGMAQAEKQGFDLGGWLWGQSYRVQRFMATRAVLRVLPLVL